MMRHFGLPFLYLFFIGSSNSDSIYMLSHYENGERHIIYISMILMCDSYTKFNIGKI